MRLYPVRRHNDIGSQASPQLTRGYLDAPTTTIVSRGPATISGWALVGATAPAEVRVVVNSRTPMSAQVGIDRPDVGRALDMPEAPVACGWSVDVDLADEPPGDLRIQVFALDAQSNSAVIADRLFALRGEGVRGAIELPADGARITGDLLVVRGWAVAADKVATVDVVVDGHVLGQARVGLGHPGGPAGAGFEFRGVIERNGDGGEHEVAVGVADQRGNRFELGSIGVTLTQTSLSPDDGAVIERLQQRTIDALARPSAAGSRSRRDLLVFTHSLALGGGQLYLQDLVTGLAPALERCTVVSPVTGTLAAGLETAGADVVVNGRGLPSDVASYEGAVREIALFIRASGCSCVLINTLGQWVAGDAAQRAGVPCIWAIHESFELPDWLDLNFGGRSMTPYIRERLEATLRGASRVIFEADATRAMYLRAGVKPSAALTVPYGVDIDAIDTYAAAFDREAARRQHGLAMDASVLLCVGVFEQRKAQAWLAAAFAQVADVHPDAVLVLVGDHPAPYSTTVREVVDGAGLGERVRIVPITSDIWEWYGLADILVSASDVESFPRSMMEAMAFGCPVLAADVHGIPELISEGATGWLMRARDTVALVAGLHRVLSLDAVARGSVGKASQDLVRKSYRSSGYVETYLKLIDEVERG